MGRPFAVWGFFVYGALLLAAWGGTNAAGIAFCVCAGSSLCFAVLWRFSSQPWVFAKRAPIFSVACLLAALALAGYLSRFRTQVEPVQRWAGEPCSVRARVLDWPEQRYHRYYYRLRVEEVNKTTTRPFTIRLSASSPLYCEPYDWVECSVGFYAFDAEGLYSQKNIRLAGGYQLGAYLAGGGGKRIVCEEDSFGKSLAQLRKTLSRKFSQLLPPDDAGLLQAMLLGDRDSLLQDAYEDFRLIGCAHLLVVSGLHMGAVAGLLTLILRRTRLRRFPRTVVSTAVLLGYLAVTGFPVSGVRAFTMCAVYLLAGCLGRRADSVNSLGLALLLICLSDPFSGGDLSLALSVFATLGIVVLSPKIRAALLRPAKAHPRFKKIWNPIASGLSVTLSVMVFTVPWQVFAFRGVSLLSPLANLLLVAPCTLLLYCALLTLVFSCLPGLAPLARPFAFCAGMLGRLARSIAKTLASEPRAYVYLGPVETVLFIGVLVILLLLCLPKKQRLRGRVLAGMLAVCLVFLAVAARTPDVLTRVEDGDCLLVVKGREAVVLQVGEREDDCVALLREHHVERVTALFLGDDGAAYRLSARKVLQSFPTDRLLLPAGTYVGRDFAGVEVTYENSPFTVALADGIIGVAVGPEGEIRVWEGSQWAG